MGKYILSHRKNNITDQPTTPDSPVQNGLGFKIESEDNSVVGTYIWDESTLCFKQGFGGHRVYEYEYGQWALADANYNILAKNNVTGPYELYQRFEKSVEELIKVLCKNNGWASRRWNEDREIIEWDYDRLLYI